MQNRDGFRLIPGACGVARLADLDGRQRLALLEQLTSLERVADTVIIDTAAGLSTNVLAFAAAARRVTPALSPPAPGGGRRGRRRGRVRPGCGPRRLGQTAGWPALSQSPPARAAWARATSP